MDIVERAMNPWKEYWPSRGLNMPPVVKFCTLPFELRGPPQRLWGDNSGEKKKKKHRERDLLEKC